MPAGQVFYKTDHGLLIPDDAVGDQKAIARKLKEYDPALRLVPQQGGYRVYRYMGSERPAEFLLFWGDHNGPYELSSKIIEEIQKMDKNSRGHQYYESPEQKNQRLKETQAKDMESAAQDLADDWKSIQGRIPHMAGVRGKLR